jgi:hypothetical protein
VLRDEQVDEFINPTKGLSMATGWHHQHAGATSSRTEIVYIAKPLKNSFNAQRP